MAWTQVVAVRFQEQCRGLDCWLSGGDEGQGGVNNDAQPLAWMTRWLVVLFNEMEALEQEGGETMSSISGRPYLTFPDPVLRLMAVSKLERPPLYPLIKSNHKKSLQS